MSANSTPLSGNALTPLQRVSLNSTLTNIVLDSDSGNSSLVVKTGTADALYIDKYSNVGIGTISPGAQLEVASANGACMRLRYGTSSSAYASLSTSSNGNLTIGANAGSVVVSSPMTISGDVIIGGSLSLSNGSIAAQLGLIDPNAIGVVAAGKAMIADSNRSIINVNNLGAATLTLGSSVISTADAAFLSGLTSGAATAGKALILDSGKSVSGITSLAATSLSGALQTAAQPNITSVGTLAALTVSGATTLQSTADATSSSSGGALSVSGGLAVAKSVFIGGNLTVSGTTTAVNSTVVSIADNTLMLNASPTGPSDSGILVTRYQTANDSALGNVVADTPYATTTVASATTNSIAIASGSAVDGYYSGWWLLVNNQARRVTGYTGTSRTATLASALSIVPLAGDTVRLYNRSYAAVVWSETAKQMQTVFTASDSSTALTVIEDAPLKAGAFTASGAASILSTTEASSSVSGALTIAGGAGIAKSLYVGTGIYGTLQTAAQTNITSVGTLSSLNVGTSNSNALVLTNTTSAGTSNIRFTNDSQSISVGLTGSAASPANSFYISASSTQLVILPSGNVGIGTTSPGYRLDIGGSLNASSFSLSGSSLSMGLLSGSIIAGSAVASRVLSVDANLDVSGIRNLTMSGSLTIGAATVGATELGYITGITPGTVSASKALIASSGKTLSGLSSLSLVNASPSGVVSQTFASDTYTLIAGVQGSASSISANSVYWHFNGQYRLFMNSNGNLALGISTVDASSFNYKLNVGGSINASSYYLNGAVLNMDIIQGPTAGTASASRALVVDGAVSISGINSLGATSVVVGGSTLTATNAGYLTNVQPGVAAAGKAVIADVGTLNVTGIGLLSVGSLLVDGQPVISANNAALQYIANVTPGSATASTALVVDANLDISNIHRIGVSDATTTGYAALTLSGNTQTLEIGARGSANTSGAGLAYVAFGGSDRVLMNASGNIAVGTTSVGTHKMNISGSLNASSYYLNGTLLSLDSLSLISGITPGTAAASKALILDASSNISGIASLSASSLTIGSSTVTTQLGYLLATAGTAAPSKALIADATVSISGIGQLGCSTLNLNGSSIHAEAAFIAGVSKGTAAAGKMLVLDDLGSATGINALSMASLTIGSTPITPTMIGYLSGITAGTAAIGKALIADTSLGISGLGQVGCSSLLLGGNLLTADQFTYINNLVAGTITKNRAIVLGDNYEATFGTTSIVFTNNMFNIQLANDSSTDYAIVQRWTNAASTTLMTDISFSNYACRFGTYSNHALRLITNNQTRVYMDTLGNVGIGDNTPSYMLDVSGTARAGKLLVGTSTDTSSRMMISALDSAMTATQSRCLAIGQAAATANQAEVSFYYAGSASTNNRLDLGSYNSPLMSVRFDGHVGIGTTTPAYMLEVGGTLGTAGSIRTVGGSDASSGAGLCLYYDTTNGIANINCYDYTAAAQKSVGINGTTIFVKGSTGGVGLGTSALSSGKRLTVNGSVDILGSGLYFDGVGFTSSQFLNITAGTAGASKALVLSSLKDIGSLRHFTAQNINVQGGGSTDDFILPARLINAIDDTMGIGSNAFITLGKSLTSKNSGEIAFHWDSNSSDNNYMSLGGFGFSDTIKIMASRDVFCSNATLTVDKYLRVNGSALSSYNITVNYAKANNLGYYGDQPASVGSPYTPSMSAYFGYDIVLFGTVYIYSDRRLKRDIQDFDVADDAIMRLRPVSFKWKRDDTPDFGLIAQDTMKAIPELTGIVPDDELEVESVEDPPGGRMNVSYQKLGVAMLPALQRLIRRVSELEEQVRSLNARLS